MAVAVALPPVRPAPLSATMDLDEDDADMDSLFARVDEKRLEEQEASDPMAYLAYYKYLLPWKTIFTWLNRTYTPTATTSRNFTHREFTFTLQNEAYLRYNSFSTPEELKREVCRLNPARFEIGPVYSAKPKDRKTVQKTSFRPVSRELVFDIDMTDYDEIRTCCSGKGICKRCWAFIAVAVKVLDEMIRCDFGYKHLLWVYSGRRGIHCWISDQEACELSDDSRRAIVGWIDIIKGSANQTKKVDVGASFAGTKENRRLHPSIQRAMGDENRPGPLKTAFVEIILKDQDCFRDPKQAETLLSLLPASEIETIAKLKHSWSRDVNRSSYRKWTDIQEAASKSKKGTNVWKNAMEDIILQYTYPRIDSEVSKHLNHLLKSPFVIHPATGKVCVPLQISTIEDFDPINDCPNVAQLLREMNRALKKAGISTSHEKGQLSSLKAYWDQTSLKPFVEVMDRHCQAILKDDREAKKALESKSFDF
ncbi:hypothetical protein CBS101457_001507 [Exobasidium rhododendri]|nr:hypothetical protein CBS101457_001507 [Exobasidium rhododendri]